MKKRQPPIKVVLMVAVFLAVLFLMGYDALAQTPDSFSIKIVTANIDCVEINEWSSAQDNNSGALNDFTLGDNFIPQTRLRHTLFNFPTLADSMIAVGAATWDSAKIRVYTKTEVIEVAETLSVVVHKMISLWDEGDGTNQDNWAGVTFDSASASGSGGGSGNPNAPLSWATDPDFETDDYSATLEAQLGGDTVRFAGEDVAAGQEYYFRISSATISDTLGEGIVLFASEMITGDNECYLEFNSDDAVVEADRPWLEVFYTTGVEPPEPLRKRRRKIIIMGDNRYEKDAVLHSLFAMPYVSK